MSVFYSGVNQSLPGDGGPECVQYISPFQRYFETAMVIPICTGIVLWSWSKLELPTTLTPMGAYHRDLRRVILLTLAMVFGTETGFKMASSTLVYLMNPCHVSTAIQLLFLSFDVENRWTTLLFRFHIYSLSGATLALVFPVLNTRTYTLEIFLYWAQHFLIQLVPVYLLTLKGPYTIEKSSNWATGLLSFAILMLYHFVIMQYIGMVVEVNLNSMICPAVSDPFHGKFWRVCAFLHQFLYIPIHGKLYGLAAQYIADKWVSIYDAGVGERKKHEDRSRSNGGPRLTFDKSNIIHQPILIDTFHSPTPWNGHF